MSEIFLDSQFWDHMNVYGMGNSAENFDVAI